MAFTQAGLVTGAMVYALGVSRVWRHQGDGNGVLRTQAAAFTGAWVALWIALVALPAPSAIRFSMHMVQHELLLLVAAPLMAFARPGVAALWALPADGRHLIESAMRARGTAQVWRGLTAPLSAAAIQAVALWAWHVPRLFDAALDNSGVHALEHLTFFLSAMLFWWVMLHDRDGRAGYGVAAGFVFLTLLHSSALGMLLTLSSQVWYAPYLLVAREPGFDPVSDQQLAGLLMWMPAGVVLMALGLALLAAWLASAARRQVLEEQLNAGQSPRGVR